MVGIMMRISGKSAAVGVVGILVSALLLTGCNSTTTALPEGGTVKVSGTGTATSVPDAAKVAFTISVLAPTSAEASSQAAKVESEVLAALKSQGVADADITTETVSVGPEYDASGRTQKLTGYRARQSFTVLVRDVSKAGSVIDAVVAAGGDNVQIDGTTLIVSNPVKAEAQAREKAAASARVKAEEYARSLGFTLGDIVSVNELSQSQPVMSANADAAASPSTKIMPGTADVSVVVEVEWQVIQ